LNKSINRTAAYINGGFINDMSLASRILEDIFKVLGLGLSRACISKEHTNAVKNFSKVTE